MDLCAIPADVFLHYLIPVIAMSSRSANEFAIIGRLATLCKASAKAVRRALEEIARAGRVISTRTAPHICILPNGLYHGMHYTVSATSTGQALHHVLSWYQWGRPIPITITCGVPTTAMRPMVCPAALLRRNVVIDMSPIVTESSEDINEKLRSLMLCIVEKYHNNDPLDRISGGSFILVDSCRIRVDLRR